jgi:murein DD-endopeptidase MepM/ murein hydrolase activator NlpD
MKRFGYAVAPVLVAALLSACASGARVISGFGGPQDGEGKPRGWAHTGVDVWGNPGDPVLAGASGRVVAAAEEPSGLASCGKYVVLEHDAPNVLIAPKTTYCHFEMVSAKVGGTSSTAAISSGPLARPGGDKGL